MVIEKAGKFVAMALASALVLAGCYPPGLAAPAPEAHCTAAPPYPGGGATSSLMPQPTRSTETPAPTAATPTALATAPSGGGADLAATTPDPSVTALIAEVKASGAPQETTFSSPDGRWRVQVARWPCTATSQGSRNAWETLTVAPAGSGDQILADSQLIYCEGLGAYGLEGLSWSPKGRYFYYTTAREGSPDGLCGYWPLPLRRLDAAAVLAAGGHASPNEMLIPGVEEVGGGVLSPDGVRLAAWRDGTLSVWELDGSTPAPVPGVGPDLPPGPVAWSPDGGAIAALQSTNPCSGPATPHSRLVVVSAPDLAPLAMLETGEHQFGSVEWLDPQTLRLTAEDGSRWRYEPDAGTLIREA
jgi:hypothetical protein